MYSQVVCLLPMLCSFQNLFPLFQWHAFKLVFWKRYETKRMATIHNNFTFFYYYQLQIVSKGPVLLLTTENCCRISMSTFFFPIKKVQCFMNCHVGVVQRSSDVSCDTTRRQLNTPFQDSRPPFWIYLADLFELEGRLVFRTWLSRSFFMF